MLNFVCISSIFSSCSQSKNATRTRLNVSLQKSGVQSADTSEGAFSSLHIKDGRVYQMESATIE